MSPRRFLPDGSVGGEPAWRSCCKRRGGGQLLRLPRRGLLSPVSEARRDCSPDVEAGVAALASNCEILDNQTMRFFKGRLSLIHISEPTRRTPISYAVF